MRWKWLVAGLVVAGIAAALLRRRFAGGYDYDSVDSAGPGEFGDRGADAPEQRWTPASTRRNSSPDELSTAARVETSLAAIHEVWPAVTDDEIRSAEANLDRLAQLIAEKSEQPLDEVRQRMDEILGRETPRPSFPAH